MPASEAHLDAPRELRRVVHREAFSDSLAGVAFVDGVAQSGMPASVLARLIGIGIPLSDCGPWGVAAPVVPPAPPPAPTPPAPPQRPKR